MTTATANRAPTEAEIRAIIDAHAIGDPLELAYNITQAVHYIPEGERTGGENRLYVNLRHSEAERLGELLDDVFTLAEKVAKQLEDATVAACLQFAAEYPDAPRAEVPQPV
jgi:hypothetical protein